ncbi:MAG: hypothetical protein HZB16_20755 [Armatimonadetes bacterium]|nr:hypothetical protein [Armatimonadota bacterium]
MAHKTYNGEYSGERLSRVAFPMGGMGAGTICLEGSGALSHVSLRHRPDVFNEPLMFAAVCIKGERHTARVVEGPVPTWKLYGTPGAANGLGGTSFGLPRFRSATFRARFPFGEVALSDSSLPLTATITGWSPFEPNDADNASLPAVGLEYTFTNTSGAPLEAVFSFNARNFMSVSGNPSAVRAVEGGFVLWGGPGEGKPHDEGAFSATVSEPDTCVDCAYFRGGWFDPLTILWRDIQAGRCENRAPYSDGAASPGASLQVPLALAAGESRTITVRLTWYVGQSTQRAEGVPDTDPAYVPWYAGRFADIEAVNAYWRDSYARLRANSQCFADCFYDSTLPAEVVEAVSANLGILKSPTVLRQSDGRLWGWEGCGDRDGCCHGSCTHVWNYAQAIPHLFPALERTLRETEFGPCQDERGHQGFRAALPIRVIGHGFHAAADGQLGGILKVYRDWRIAGDTEWLRGLWASVRRSLDYCIEAWDPEGRGWLEEPHHNTYDIEFWGPDGMCTSFYLGALRAAVLMGEALDDDVALYAELLARGIERTETELYDGEYFIQKVQWTGLRAPDPTQVSSYGGAYSAEALAILAKEGPKYQYGLGCLSDGVLGEWMAAVCGVGQVLDADKVASHLGAVHRYNLKRDLSDHANPQRPTFACGDEGGLLLCSWPKGGELALPMVYSDEVWTGIEYQVASHLILTGQLDAGLEVVRVCRDRYDGRVRNPFNEYECGHWYARALASYALLQSLSGARYDAIDRTLYLKPALEGDFACFLSTATGYGLVGRRDGHPFVEVRAGSIDVHAIVTE